MFVSPNELRRSIEASNPTIGTWMQIPSAEIAEILSATESYEWIVVDMEHGSFSRENLPSIIRAFEKYNVLPFVRLKTNEKSSVKDIVDCGFCGYIAPMIGSVSQLKEIYEEFTYPPLGKRGVGFSRSNQYGINFEKKVGNSLMHKFNCIKAASLLRETMWSMVAEIVSKIDFDYKNYTEQNLENFYLAYKKLKF